jgi:hypothetical protein
MMGLSSFTIRASDDVPDHFLASLTISYEAARQAFQGVADVGEPVAAGAGLWVRRRKVTA